MSSITPKAKLLVSSICLALGGAMLATPAAAGGLTGHLDLASKYYLRGITTTYGPTLPGGGNVVGDAPENENVALQGGLDYAFDSGFYLGWWFSTLSYSYKDFTNNGSSVEHDLYGGYKGKIGDFGYQLGLTHYTYVPSVDADAFETNLGISYGSFGLNAQTLLDDVTYGNAGDTYWTATYSTALPSDFTFNAILGYYTYEKTGKFINDGAFKQISGGFRNLTLGVSYPFTKQITGSLNYIVGGENRWGVDQDNKFYGTVSYAF